MEPKAETVIRMRVVKKNAYCPIFNLGDEVVIKKHCFDTSINRLERYCYATLSDIYPVYAKLRKEPVGTTELFRCRDNGIIEIEVERLADERYDYENAGRVWAPAPTGRKL